MGSISPNHALLLFRKLEEKAQARVCLGILGNRGVVVLYGFLCGIFRVRAGHDFRLVFSGLFHVQAKERGATATV